MAKKRPAVSVIVLNWNGIRYTEKCIKCLKKQSYKDFEIVVVDNGSTRDNSVEVLKKISGIKLVLNKKNYGFAGGNNIGVRASSSTKYVALINNDTEFPKDWLKELVKAMERYPELGQAMSKVYNKYSGKNYTFKFYGTSTYLHFLASHDFSVSEKAYMPISTATGGALIYRKKLVDVPFDDDYFIYHEDSYFGWLLNLRGYKSGVILSSIVYHEGEATVKQAKGLSAFYAYLGERNRLMNLFIFYSLPTLLKLLPLIFLTTFLLNIFNFKRVPARLKSYLWLLSHVFLILSKRSKIQRQRKVPDSKIMIYMSAKLFEERMFGNKFVKILIKILNKFSFAYARLLGLKSIELNRKEAGF